MKWDYQSTDVCSTGYEGCGLEMYTQDIYDSLTDTERNTFVEKSV